MPVAYIVPDEIRYFQVTCPQYREKQPYTTQTETWLQGVENTLTEQGKVRSAIHGSFEQFELVDLAFHLTIWEEGEKDTLPSSTPREN